MKPVRWGVLSVSTHYRLRVNTNVRKSSIVEVCAIASRSLTKANTAAEKLGIPRAYGSYDELLSDPHIEAVYIPLPNHLHAEWVKKAADAGKHVLCEKPFALNAEEAKDAIDYATAKGVLVMEAFMYRFHPQWLKACELVRCGEIGEIRAIHSLFSYMLKDPQNYRNNYESGGGSILDIGTYAVSCARFLIGTEPSRVVSLINRDPDFGTDILSSAILDFGATHVLFTVGTQAQSWQHVEVIGSGGELSINIPFNAYPDVPAEISVTTGVGQRTIPLSVCDQYVQLFEAFSRAIRGAGPVPLATQDTVDNMKVLDALFRSEKSGTWENV